MAATLAFFSATRFCIRALKEMLIQGNGSRADYYHLLVFCLLLLLAVDSTAVQGTKVTAALETDGGDQSLNFGSEKGSTFSQKGKQKRGILTP